MGGKGQRPGGPSTRGPSLAERRSRENLARSALSVVLPADDEGGKERTGMMLNMSVGADGDWLRRGSASKKHSAVAPTV